ncbi:MAG: hypothetical protein FJW63_07635 [Actinobacteria bacterium]|nr:hypothetical protein [Actinomycetota bacterium]
MNTKIKFIIPILSLVLIFSFALACNGASDQKEKEYTTEYKLAVIDKGGYLEEDDPVVSEYKIVLDSLKSKVINDEVEIADTVVKAQEILREDHQINLTILKIMKDLDTSIPEGVENLDLVEIASVYIVLLVSG